VRDALIGFMAASAQAQAEASKEAQAEASKEAQRAGIAHARAKGDRYRARAQAQLPAGTACCHAGHAGPRCRDCRHR
jgi:hypothetical protein